MKVRDYNNEAKEHNHRWRFDFVAACREQTLDTNPHVHEKEYRPRRTGE